MCIIFVVQLRENNAFDQLALSDELWTTHSIPNFRLPFSLVLDHTKVEDGNPSRPLLYHPHYLPQAYEVTTCYFRAGYSPSEYPNESSWSARLQLERSAAIKCPTILTHLAGSKKVQQILATPSSPHVERFLSRSQALSDTGAVASRIKATFAAIYPLDSSDAGRQAIDLATSPTKSAAYVLKPQREGGGNNIYGTKIPGFLQTLGDDERKWRGHILMEMIEPPRLRSTIFRNGQTKSGEVIGELGIYGACLWRSSKGRNVAEILHNEEAGWLLRTKGRDSEEGGVAAGFGAVDSVCLMDV
jgi:glutathione synthetase